jgi:DNA uptake protein ComE-like DNA-binding protein
MPQRARNRRPAFATALVIWAVALAVLILGTTQLSAWRQAADGREAVARVRAKWAARAAVEACAARLEHEATQAQPLGARTLLAQLAIDSIGDLSGATYRTRREEAGRIVDGPSDVQAKLNINTMTSADLMLLPDMTQEVADAIVDWIDADDDPGEQGSEREAYLSQPIPYITRNAPVRDLRDLELVAGVKPEWVRGEDWNLNGVLDPNEDDGDATWPPDNADGRLDAGWSAFVDTGGTFGGLASTGEERIDLTTADAQAVATALGVESAQADAIVAHVQNNSGQLADFISTNLSTIAQRNQQSQRGQGRTGGGGTGGRQQPRVRNLERAQLTTLLDRCTSGDPRAIAPGKVNLNTADERSFEYLASIDPATRDAILLFRDQFAGDMPSIADLLDAPTLTPAVVATLFPILDTRSNVFRVSAVGRDAATGLSVEIVAEVDRSTLPVTIRTLSIR